MSRGYAFTNPKELNILANCTVYDGAGWLWLFKSNGISKIFVRDILDNSQTYLNTNINSLLSVVSSRAGNYNSAVTVDDFIFVTDDAIFNKILKINIVTHQITEINTPKSMNSNLHFAASKLWMVTNDVSDQVDDRHRMYVLDLITNKWDWSYITTKKQQEGFRIWSHGTEYVYTSNWTNFNCSYFDVETGTYAGSFTLNGYPGFAADIGNHTSYVTSYGGMISLVNGTTVTHSFNSIVSCNEFNSHIAYLPGYIWFQNEEVVGRIKTADKSVIDSGSEDDTVLLFNVQLDTVDMSYIDQATYSIQNSEFKNLFVIPSYTAVNELGDLITLKAMIVLHGTKVTVFDPDLVKFVFDKPEVKDSGVFNSGKGMITTGETGYIGEFI